MVDAIIGAMVLAIVGVIAFVVIKGIVAGQSSATWSAAEVAIISVIPVAVGVLVLIGVFKSIQVR